MFCILLSSFDFKCHLISKHFLEDLNLFKKTHNLSVYQSLYLPLCILLLAKFWRDAVQRQTGGWRQEELQRLHGKHQLQRGQHHWPGPAEETGHLQLCEGLNVPHFTHHVTFDWTRCVAHSSSPKWVSSGAPPLAASSSWVIQVTEHTHYCHANSEPDLLERAEQLTTSKQCNRFIINKRQLTPRWPPHVFASCLGAPAWYPGCSLTAARWAASHGSANVAEQFVFLLVS